MSDASVALKLIDEYSANLKNMSGANRGFSKEMEEIRSSAEAASKRMSALRKDYAVYQNDLDKAKEALARVKKETKGCNDELSRGVLRKANEDVDAAKEKVTELGAAYKATEKELSNYIASAHRLTTMQHGGSGTGASGGLVKMLRDSQYANLVQPVLQSGFNYAAGSLWGDAAGEAIGTIASSIASGAAIGGPAGAAIGAAVGIGSAIIKDLQNRDEYFKSSVKEDYEDIQRYREEQIAGGSGIRGQRETLLLSYKTLMGGNQDAANELYDSLLTYANETPYTLGQLSDAGRTLLAYGYEGEQIKGLIGSIGSAAAATGSGAQGLSTMATVIGRLNAGDINARLFQQLNALGMNSFQTLAEQYNAEKGTSITGTEMKKLVSGGKITGQWAAEALLAQWGTNWGSAMQEFSKTFEGLQSTLEGLKENRQDAVGIQYNDKRKSGVEEEIKYLNNVDGKAITEIEGFYGSVQAAAENTHERYQREAEKLMLHGGYYGGFSKEINESLQEYHKKYLQYAKDLEAAKANGSEIDEQKAQIAIYNLLDSVRKEAEAAYSKSDLFGAIQEGQLDLIQNLQDATYQSWYDYGYQIAEALSKGAAAAAWNAQRGTNGSGKPVYGVDYIAPFQRADGSDAYGLSSVPYNGYLAELHQGERVLTASEARQLDEGTGGGSITVNIGDVTVRDQADAEMLAEVIVERILEARKTFVR